MRLERDGRDGRYFDYRTTRPLTREVAKIEGFNERNLDGLSLRLDVNLYNVKMK